jgi:hypothetical protein
MDQEQPAAPPRPATDLATTSEATDHHDTPFAPLAATAPSSAETASGDAGAPFHGLFDDNAADQLVASDPSKKAPGETASLVIRQKDSIWPVKMAEIATGDANRYVELNALNPDKCKGGNWRNLFAGDKIVMPHDWARNIAKAGYQIEGSNPEPAKAVAQITVDSPANGGTYTTENPPRMIYTIHSEPGDRVSIHGALFCNEELVHHEDFADVCDKDGIVRRDAEVNWNAVGNCRLVTSISNIVNVKDPSGRTEDLDGVPFGPRETESSLQTTQFTISNASTLKTPPPV